MAANWTEEDLQAALTRQNQPRPACTPANGIVESAQESQKLPKSTMNKTEARFAQWLDLQVRAGVIKRWWFESMKLRIGHDCWWTMDFMAEYPNGSVVIYDTKGTRMRKAGGTAPYAKDDAVVKARAVADKFPIPVFFAWLEKNGEWQMKRM